MKQFLNGIWCILLLTLAGCGGGGGGNNGGISTCADDNVSSVETAKGCLQLLSTSPVNSPRILWVFIHGDGSSQQASDGMFDQLSSIATADSMSIGLIRPGYFTLDGRRSTGPESDRRYDHYTQAAVDNIADGLLVLKAHYQPDALIVVGYSGGAATTALVSSFYPGLIDKTVLVACPCNVPEWRTHRRGFNNWPRSLSPHNYVNQLDATVPLLAIVGSDDTNTYPQLSIDYVALAQTAGVNAQYEVIQGADHSSIVFEREPLITFLSQWAAD